jgi:predicted porin
MKKSLLALAVLGAFSGVASAQSSVQLFGTLDVNGRYLKNDGRDRQLSMGTDGVNSSEIRFQGIEDLGGGLKAGFNLRSGINPDTGTSNAKFWNRRATVSLYSNAGELRLGRDYVPTFWTTAIFDAFGYNGLGSTGNVNRGGQVRQDNSIGYFLPSNLGGFYGQLMVAAGENGTSGDRNGRYLGGQFGFRAGPFDIALAYSENRLGIVSIPASNLTGAASVPAGETEKKGNIGGSFDFGFMKIMGYYNENKYPNAKEKVASISGIFPFGQSEVRVGYDLSKMDQKQAGFADSDLENIKATYQYNLSKRTALYGTVALLRNKDNTIVSLPGTNFAGGTPSAGGDSKGFELGVRHFF